MICQEIRWCFFESRLLEIMLLFKGNDNYKSECDNVFLPATVIHSFCWPNIFQQPLNNKFSDSSEGLLFNLKLGLPMTLKQQLIMIICKFRIVQLHMFSFFRTRCIFDWNLRCQSLSHQTCRNTLVFWLLWIQNFFHSSLKLNWQVLNPHPVAHLLVI